jgi:hypothetical protein
LLKRLVWLALLGISALALVLAAGYEGLLGRLEAPGEIAPTPRSTARVAGESAAQRAATHAVGAPPERQILFGDLHVHTTFSMDAFLTSLPVMQGEGAHPPADACDFARHCSALDFFSINDHAEGLTPDKWSEIKGAVRQCNAVAGDPVSPDLVAYLGWEWTQMSAAPESHYGHKNVVLRDTEEERTPARPIAALGDAYQGMRTARGRIPMLGMSVRDFANRQRYLDLIALMEAVSDVPLCPEGVSVRELPPDCSEAVATPRELFDKLDDWGLPSLVIPHGNAWGNTTPAGVDWEKQLANGQHDPKRQTLVEVYSGHGSSEAYRPWRHVTWGPDGEPVCPAPGDDFTPECHRAGELIRERCLTAGDSAETCEERSAAARKRYLAAGRVGPLVVPGEVAEDWLDAGQCVDCFQPAFQYRPGGSVQNALAVSGAGVPGASDDPKQRFRFGLIASSDNHTARSASGYKEFRAMGMTDTLHADGTAELRSILPVERERLPESIAIDPAKVAMLPGGDERLTSFFYTGGLVAVHAEGRDRDAIWRALERKEVYGTSGPRILLWFDLLNGPAGAPQPMGSEATLAETPRFRVRAVGSREQLPGCPDDSITGLGPERLAALCLGECHHPSDRRRVIERIEVVRIRPRRDRGEDVAALIEDPWRVFPCRREQQGCVVEFEDVEFAVSGRDAVYYVRALEEPREHVNGDPLRCVRDADGVCLATRPCRPGGTGSDADECLAPSQARAWSSPIFLDSNGKAG